MTVLARILDRFRDWWTPNSPSVAFSCDHCGIIRAVKVRKVTVHQTPYARESFAQVTCTECGGIVARRVSASSANDPVGDGAKLRPFRDTPSLTESDVERFVASIDAELAELLS